VSFRPRGHPVTTHNPSLLALAADYGGATRQDLIADLDRQVAALDRQINDVEESLDGNGWPEIATEPSFLEDKRAELESQRADLERVEALDALEDYAVVDGIHTFYCR
jgi:hypothetical protein